MAPNSSGVGFEAEWIVVLGYTFRRSIYFPFKINALQAPLTPAYPHSVSSRCTTTVIRRQVGLKAAHLRLCMSGDKVN